MKSSVLNICVFGNSLLLILIAIYFFFSPIIIITKDINDPGLHNGDIPSFTYRWHKNISEGFSTWASNRVDSNRASSLNIEDISGTEWPMFSAVYYLWATEELQKSWQKNPLLSDRSPIDYAEETIRAAAALIADKDNAAWVIKHWGDDYLKKDNLFYRMLLISGLTSFEKLLADQKYHELLSNQVQTLAKELDSSPHGLLDDYPGQCYPVDILPAIAAIKRTQDLINQDYSGLITRAKRGFSGDLLDPKTMLPAYIANSKSGQSYGPARGVGISYMLIWAPEIWPTVANDWYEKYEQHFWQENNFIVGVREFSTGSGFPDWFMDVDSGPVLAGLGTASSAFGIGAARVNGNFEHAHPISTEALAASWPLPNGTLLIPRLLSGIGALK